MSGSPRLSERARDLLASSDPVAAFEAAHACGDLISLRTSGTSSAPRSVLRTTQSWVSSFSHVTALLALDDRSRVWVPGPVSSTMNLFAAVHASSVGAAMVTSPGQASHAHLTPSALARALDGGLPLADVHVLVAGDRLRPSLHGRAERAGARVSHYYGAAELSFVGWGPHEDDLRPFPGVEVASRGGELWVRSAYLCAEYAGPGGTLRLDGDGFATVGDRGTVRDGLIVVAGRGDDAVTTGGATVHVADVEAVLRDVVEGEVVVLGLPHPELGEVVTAVLTDRRSHPLARSTARSCLSPAQRPRRWYEVPDLPTTPADKVDRGALRRLLVTPGDGVETLR